MKKESSSRFKNYKTIQKIGVTLTLMGAAIIVGKMIGLRSAGDFIQEDFPNYLFLAGALLMYLSFL